ncbi:trihelix transcription factor PTL-like isoform X2 [Hibiscus syriacus]|uniref:trihelix transcription factor PTL-like isoform X2 n=1 Tax=Hibiscus syriacus TaxID=106335 RepID=UPI0019226259|nr:trihelix transcription factor PTL-like isoform X2 [Hibiscus syriacus]
MEMEDHRHQQYSIPDLRQLLNGKPINFQDFPLDTTELFSPGHRNHHPFDMMQMVGMQVGSTADNNNTSDPMAAIATVTSASTLSPSCGFDGDTATGFRGDGGTGRWPRQETLTLLEIRSRLDPKFKEANQKGPLWDEVSRIMLKEHGYQRSGRKCREKFENLYKYYKNTKEGKAGRQDGKHYRFFRQLEALYGGNICNNNGVSGQEAHLVGNACHFRGIQPNQEIYHSQKLCDNILSLSTSSKFDSSSSDNNELSTTKKRGCRRWKAKIKEFIDSQIGMLMERQEAWLAKLTKMLEQNEEERVLREEQWRKEEASRIDREHKFWAKERSWIEARDAALMEALQNLTAKQLNAATASTDSENHNEREDGWKEAEVSKLIHLRNAMEPRFQQGGYTEEVVLWEEIAGKMSCLGFERSSLMCKNKWSRLIKTKEMMRNKKRKENSRGYDYYHHQQNESMYSTQADDGSSHGVNDGCFRFFMADGENNLWENHGLKLSN